MQSQEYERPARRHWSRLALVCLSVTTLTAQQPTTIRVPVRLVSVPTLVLASDGRVLPNLHPADFQLFDNQRPRPFTLDAAVSPVSVVIAVQANSDTRAYLPFIAKVGSALDALLIGESGESAAIVYGDEVTVAKPFDSGDLSSTLRKLAPDGRHAHAIDAGMRAIELLRQRPASRARVVLFIGQPVDKGSKSRLEDLRREAERDNVTIHALALPEIGKAFISDTFSLRGPTIEERGGFRAEVNLLHLIPTLARAASAVVKAGPFDLLTAATGGTQLHFRKQNQLEDAIAIVGVQLRSAYVLSFTPDSDAPGYHTIRVAVAVPGAKIHTRPGYWLSAN